MRDNKRVMKKEILKMVQVLCKEMTEQEQADFLWEVICETTLEDATMDRVYGGYEVFLQMNDEE